ncbi:MAG: formate dehydrogenase subunit gamma [Candidatus Binataceae bacterium]
MAPNWKITGIERGRGGRLLTLWPAYTFWIAGRFGLTFWVEAARAINSLVLSLYAVLSMRMNESPDWDPRTIERIAASLKDEPGALLLILREVVETLGWAPRESIPIIASALNLSRAEVHGVAAFYHDFRAAAPGRNIIRICRAESCQALGGAALAGHVRRRLGIDFGETTDDRAFTLEPVYCLGNCACSPAIVVNGELYGRVTPERFDKLASRLADKLADQLER